MILHCDGGVIGSNPSSVGGSWAWCQVVGDEIVASDGHILTPKEVGLPRITNNMTELYAAIKALESLPRFVFPTLYTDSLVTLRRVRDPLRGKFNGIPDVIRERLIASVQRLGKIEVILVGGHPTKEELESGFKVKNNLPTSKWNVWCDRKCNEVKAEMEPAIRQEMAAKMVKECEWKLKVAKTIHGIESEEVAAPPAQTGGAA